MDTGEQVYSVEEVAAMYGVSRSSIYRAIQDREIGFVQIRGGIRFTRTHIDDYLRRSEHKPVKRSR